MKELFELSAAIIASVGGAGFIVIGLSNWLGKIWANRILENEKEKHTKEIEKYKNELVMELEHLKRYNEKNIFVSKLQFEKEFEIYLELWESLFDVYVCTNSLFARIDSFPQDLDERNKHFHERYKRFSEAYNIYLKTIIKYAPFYSKDIYTEFDSIREICRKQGINFEVYRLENVGDKIEIEKEVRKEIYTEIPEELERKVNYLQDKIRNYLISLKVN